MTASTTARAHHVVVLAVLFPDELLVPLWLKQLFAEQRVHEAVFDSVELALDVRKPDQSDGRTPNVGWATAEQFNGRSITTSGTSSWKPTALPHCHCNATNDMDWRARMCVSVCVCVYAFVCTCLVGRWVGRGLTCPPPSCRPPWACRSAAHRATPCGASPCPCPWDCRRS